MRNKAKGVHETCINGRVLTYGGCFGVIWMKTCFSNKGFDMIKLSFHSITRESSENLMNEAIFSDIILSRFIHSIKVHRCHEICMKVYLLTPYSPQHFKLGNLINVRASVVILSFRKEPVW